MKANCLIAISAVAFAALVACASPDPAPADSGAGPAPGSLSLSVEPGPEWTHRYKLFMRLSPTFAGWVETPDGEYAGTLMVSGKAGNASFIGAPAEGRPEALPVWFRASGREPPGAPDAVSSASSDSGATGSRVLGNLRRGEEYVARFEINQSFDYNDTWKSGGKRGERGWSGVNGQPSLVYEACFIAGSPESLELRPIGRGSVDGSDGAVAPGLDGFTTALHIVKNITLEVH